MFIKNLAIEDKRNNYRRCMVYEEVMDMCNFSGFIEQRGIEKGLEKGLE